MKLYGTPLLANSLAGALYEVFWCLLAFAAFPSRGNAWRIAVIVFLATGGLEFVQLFDHPLLDSIRSTFIGRTLIGNAFAWSDFVYYAMGCLASWSVMRAIAPRSPYTHSYSSGG